MSDSAFQPSGILRMRARRCLRNNSWGSGGPPCLPALALAQARWPIRLARSSALPQLTGTEACDYSIRDFISKTRPWSLFPHV